MTLEQINSMLKTDAAYQYSVENNDIINMQIVLRAYDLDHNFDDAMAVISHAKQVGA